MDGDGLQRGGLHEAGLISLSLCLAAAFSAYAFPMRAERAAEGEPALEIAEWLS